MSSGYEGLKTISGVWKLCPLGGSHVLCESNLVAVVRKIPLTEIWLSGSQQTKYTFLMRKVVYIAAMNPRLVPQAKGVLPSCI